MVLKGSPKFPSHPNVLKVDGVGGLEGGSRWSEQDLRGHYLPTELSQMSTAALSPFCNSMLREKHVETSEVSFKRRSWMALVNGYLSNRGAKTCCDICQLLCEKI